MAIERRITAISDIEERERALDTSLSFIVQAPAGSGKTELLMQRFLALLAIAGDPSEVLAVTFTRKAAGEMRSRIIEALREAGAGADPEEPHRKKTIGLARAALERDRSLGWGILDNPSLLKIKTIDSLSAWLARDLPVLSRLGGVPSVSDVPEELYMEAARRAIASVEEGTPEGESVRKALRHLDNSPAALSERLVAMLSRRDQWLRHVGRASAGGDLRGFLEGSIKRLVERELEKVCEAFPERLKAVLMESRRYAAGNLEKAGSSSPVVALKGLSAFPGATVDDLPAWRGICELLTTKEGAIRRPAGVNVNNGFPPDKSLKAAKYKDDFKALLEELAGEALLARRLGRVRTLPDPVYSDEDWEILESIHGLLPLAGRHLAQVFAERGEVDYQEVAMAALKSLGEEDSPTDLMLAMDLRLRHILVDEYQDTSRTQLELLRALTRGWEPGDGRTLFIVGDPMQSIYLFREAEVGLFLDARASGVGSVALDSITLRANFRSQKKIVDWVNDSFRSAFPDDEDSFLGAISYSLSHAVKEELERVEVEPHVFLERNDLEEARRVVEIVKGVDSGESVAVLVRSRQHLAGIVRAFKDAGIEYTAQEIDPLTESPFVQDLFALLRALVNPLDRVAWLAVMRAPWCGLTLRDMHALVSEDPSAPVWALMNDEKLLMRLSGDGRERIGRLAERLGKALPLAGRVSPRALLEGLWIDLGGPATLPEPSRLKDVDAFLGAVDTVTLAGSVTSLDTLEERLARAFVSPGAPAGRPVELMTIHKAKGLEFDHVILPGLGKPPRGREKELLLWLERGGDLILSPMEKKSSWKNSGASLYDYIRGINKEKEELEKTRLFYVAATRAKKQLHLFAHVRGPAEGELSFNRRSLFKVIEGNCPGLKTVNNTPGEGAPSPGTPEKGFSQPRPRRLQRSYAPEAPLPAVGVWTPPPMAPDIKPEFHWAGTTAKHVGTVVHRYLCRIAREGLSSWELPRVAAELASIEAMLKGLGLNASDARSSAVKAVDYIKTALGDERGRWALSPHRDGAVELPLTALIEGRVVHVVIDRTFVDEKGLRWVIDYKTGVHGGGSIEEFLANEMERYRAQLERYSAVLRARGEKREIRKGLYYPALSRFMELD